MATLAEAVARLLHRQTPANFTAGVCYNDTAAESLSGRSSLCVRAPARQTRSNGNRGT